MIGQRQLHCICLDMGSVAFEDGSNWMVVDGVGKLACHDLVWILGLTNDSMVTGLMQGYLRRWVGDPVIYEQLPVKLILASRSGHMEENLFFKMGWTGNNHGMIAWWGLRSAMLCKIIWSWAVLNPIHMAWSGPQAVHLDTPDLIMDLEQGLTQQRI